MRLYLIRHAQSLNNALPEEQRVEDPALTDLGRQQAAALAALLQTARLTRLITSPFRRSLETTDAIRQRAQLTPEVWVDLHEQGGCYAGFEPAAYEGRPGMTDREIAAEFPGYRIAPEIDGAGWWKSQPYEPMAAARQRARRLIGHTLELFAGTDEHVAYVMHGDFKKLMLEELFADSPGRLARWPSQIYNASLSIVELATAATRLDQYNSTGHLPFHLLSL